MMPKNITQTEFDQQVIEASKEKPVVVDFWAAWCGPCTAMAPIFEEAAKDYGQKADFVKVNIDKEPQLASKYGIMSIPTTIFFKDGVPASQSVGLIGKEEIFAQIDNLIQKSNHQ